ncbi:hypothetical protein G9A89_008041 [Geosiphon pyriformis]|nr:hypothetical protein G9A89_008041 [Geosiphon pyriformis]
MSELVLVVGNLPDDKAVSLSGIPNKLWKHGSEEPYDWDGIFINTQLIALIETAKKILSKVLFDYISLAYSKFNFSVFAISLWHIKMCNRFIEFFGNIHMDRINKIMTDFGLSNDYKIHDKYRINTKFVLRTDRIKSGGGMTSCFAAGTFVDNIIWVGNCQASTQYTLDIVSEFFVINNIFINSEKTVAIPINQGVRVASFSICGQPILIAKKGEAHCYLEIFLSMKKLFKLSVVKAYFDIHFFINVLLKKTVTDKQFLYLVLAVLQSIDVMIRKGLKSKTCLPYNFPSETLHYPSLYGLKSFEQVQAESKLAAIISFSNVHGILGHLFHYQFLDLQVLGWAFLDFLWFSVRLYVSPVNNFLAGVVRIFLDNKLSLTNILLSAFHNSSVFPMSLVLEKSLFFDSVCPVPYWFVLTSKFLNDKGFLKSVSVVFSSFLSGLSISDSKKFLNIQDGLHEVWSSIFEVYTDDLLKNAGSANVMSRAAAYFLDFLSSTMAELQVVALALKCVLFSCSVDLYLNSQAAIDACVSEMLFNKNLTVYWIKVKGHFKVANNVKTNTLVGEAAGSPVFLLVDVQKHFLMTEGMAVSGNTCHFVWDVFRSVCRACWKVGFSHNVISRMLVGNVNWYPNSHMLTGFTSQKLATLCMYMIKAVHYRLFVAVHKKLYNKEYSGVLCLLCDKMELPDHVFTCVWDVDIRREILFEASIFWTFLVGVHCLSFSAFRVHIEKTGLIGDDGMLSGLSCCAESVLLDTLVIAGLVFFSGLDDSFHVNIGV